MLYSCTHATVGVKWLSITVQIFCFSEYLQLGYLRSHGRLAFVVVVPAAWNSLSDDLRDPTLSTDSLRRLHVFTVSY